MWQQIALQSSNLLPRAPLTTVALLPITLAHTCFIVVVVSDRTSSYADAARISHLQELHYLPGRTIVVNSNNAARQPISDMLPCPCS